MVRKRMINKEEQFLTFRYKTNNNNFKTVLVL